ncbi:hypothetical protein FRACYDRAFT_250303 [Fragilariopsis cylindrus CCMP1102]|uniref:Uncharacterized protein n=1 Tax=Fragilariopsis cylindrus CCMP1102 TaxID=635003 RepID=A0A1E7EQ46_9STRA|nr:hypothetical protein FRACYDRAFT_250303 [Fragilariopsis cylindrus CCMP1102]|eukprot:OEU08082.1 hypothetical protein FRACYDRAFT_250303 [Fragilariopsis cylindrus CCMP1102]
MVNPWTEKNRDEGYFQDLIDEIEKNPPAIPFSLVSFYRNPLYRRLLTEIPDDLSNKQIDRILKTQIIDKLDDHLQHKKPLTRHETKEYFEPYLKKYIDLGLNTTRVPLLKLKDFQGLRKPPAFFRDASKESENRVLRQEVKSNDDEIKSIKLSLTGKENEIKQLQKEHTVALKDAEDVEEAAKKVIKSNEDKKRTEIKQLQEKHTVALKDAQETLNAKELENAALTQEIKSIKLSLTGKENEIKQLQKEHTVALKDAEDAEEAANKVIKSNEDKKRTEIKQLQEKHTVALKDAQETLNAKELANAALTQEIELTKKANTNAFNESEASHKVALDSAENRRVYELKLVEDSHEVEIDLLNVQIDKLESHVNLFFQVANTVAKASDKKTKGKTKGKHRRSLSEDGKKRNSR